MESMMYAFYYHYIDDLNPEEDINLIHFCGIYILVDFLLIMLGLFMIGKVKAKANDLVNNKRFKEYTTEAEIAT